MFFEFFGLPENKPIMKEYEIFSLYGLLKDSSAHEDHSCLNKRKEIQIEFGNTVIGGLK